jgi:hypothetical protein
VGFRSMGAAEAYLFTSQVRIRVRISLKNKGVLGLELDLGLRLVEGNRNYSTLTLI